MSVVAFERPAQGPCPALSLKIEVAHDLNALMRVFALRTLVFMGEQSCPYDEEFDGNDFTAATHLLAEIDGEPAASLRLRWFADFVKFERVLVKFEHRGGQSDIARQLVGAGVELAARRGYRTALAYAQARLGPFWGRMGFRARRGRTQFVFSDHDYVEFERTLDPHAEALSIDADPFVLMRPDGAWDVPGVLDRSTLRGASNPHR
jgi:predicted GNAT family N-acyltransferase